MAHIKKPQEIRYYLDQYVVGQDFAKKVLSVAAYQHQRRCSLEPGDIKIDKSNVLLIGETGCGKTLLAKTLADCLDVPVYIQDCTKITASGYVGSDVEDCLAGLLRECNYNLARAEKGIVVLDEVDKIARRSTDAYHDLDVSGECVQQSLLKIIEGSRVGVPPAGGRKHPEQPLVYMDSSNILFIACGAFPDLENYVGIEDAKRAQSFEARIVPPHHLYKYGMLREFIGRFSYLVRMDKLGIPELIKILKEPVNALMKQYQALLSVDGISLEFDDAALEEIAKVAIEMETGARGLRSVMDLLLLDVFWGDTRSKRSGIVKITSDYVKQKTNTTE